MTYCRPLAPHSMCLQLTSICITSGESCKTASCRGAAALLLHLPCCHLAKCGSGAYCSPILTASGMQIGLCQAVPKAADCAYSIQMQACSTRVTGFHGHAVKRLQMACKRNSQPIIYSWSVVAVRHSLSTCTARSLPRHFVCMQMAWGCYCKDLHQQL